MVNGSIPHRRRDPMQLASPFDLFVDTTEHLLVPGCSLREIHEVFYPTPTVPNRPDRTEAEERPTGPAATGLPVSVENDPGETLWA